VSEAIVRRALKLVQVSDAPVYLFTLRAGEVFRVAELSRVTRDETGELIGYQRPEVRSHVTEITSYLNDQRPLFPNALILALRPDAVRFEESRGPKDETTVAGTLRIDIPPPEMHRPAWIVDGQQRALALRNAKNQDFAVPVSAFIADTVALQRDQFIRINNTRPLPRGLVTELLPEVTISIPTRLAARQLPSALSDELARNERSPFYGLIRRASTSGQAAKHAVIADNSVIAMLEESLSNGCLFPYRNLATGQIETEPMGAILFTYWEAVKETFHEAWGKPPAESRLMHGVGIRAMGRLMDRIMTSLNVTDRETPRKVRSHLERLGPHCHWTSGRWDGIDMDWDQLQNLHKHIQMLSNYLIRLYVLGG
jgi:DGQHR domain-containing protein